MISDTQSLRGKISDTQSIEGYNIYPRGPQGPPGPTGPQGPQGDEPMYSFTIEDGYLYLESEETLDEVTYQINTNGELEVIIYDQSESRQSSRR